MVSGCFRTISITRGAWRVRWNGLILPLTTACFSFVIGALVFLPGRLRGRLSWISSTALLTGITLATIHVAEEHLANPPFWLHSWVILAKPFSVLLVVAGG